MRSKKSPGPHSIFMRLLKASLFLTVLHMCATVAKASTNPTRTLRIELRYPGVYQISGDDLRGAGVDLAGVSRGSLALSSNGTTVPFRLLAHGRVPVNATDAQVIEEIRSKSSGLDIDYTTGPAALAQPLQTHDVIEFIGSPPRGTSTWFLPDNKYNVYFLTWSAGAPPQPTNPSAGPDSGEAAQSAPGPATIYHEQQPAPVTGSAPAQYFHQWQHLENNYIHQYTMLPPSQSDNFFWFSYRAGTPPDQNFRANLTFPGFARELGRPATVDLQVYGVTRAIDLTPSHHFHFLYDLKPIGEFQFDGTALHQTSFQIPAESVLDKPARFGLATPDHRTTAVDSVVIDYVNASYPARFDLGTAELATFNNHLTAETTITDQLYVSGLPPGGTIFDSLSGAAWPLAADQSTAILPNPPHATTFTVVARAPRLSPDAITLSSPPPAPASLAPGTRALVIYHPQVQRTAQAYTQYRRERGWAIEAVSVRDIFDQYNHGYISDTVLKDYLAQVHHHAPDLSHVVLIGDAFFDYREARSYDDEERLDVLIPIHWVYRPGVTWSGGYQDDNWYGSFKNEYRPDVAVGRISINNDDEGMEYLRKIIEYETFRKSATDQAYMISSVEHSFQSYVKEIGDQYAGQLSGVRYLFPEAANATDEVLNLSKAFDDGAQLFYYVGHGGSMVWRVGPIDFARQKDLFTPADVRQLSNRTRYPVIVCASCYTTSFDQPASIGEALVNQPAGGAITVIGAPWKATVQESHDFNKLFFQYYFDPAVTTIGQASLLAHRAHISESQTHPLYNSFTLLGDPCLEILR